jgi:O-methyltransferase
MSVLRNIKKAIVKRVLANHVMQAPPFDAALNESLQYQGDYIRYAAIAMALQRVLRDAIPGDLAEVGVYKGATSRFIHSIVPERPYYLFDTFEGFPATDLDRTDERFRDTSVESVLSTIGDTHNIIIRKGRIPETFLGLEKALFSFVVLDLDLYNPTVAGLDFFYSRLSAGAYLMVHDFNNPESDFACKKALTGFMTDKPEKIVEIPDMWGTALFRKT